MTEDEAKTKWCPFARIFNTNGVYNRTDVESLGDADAKCIASECMAWRWNMSQAGINYGGGELPTDGYCGLASKP